MAECGAVSEICESNRPSGKKKNNKDSTEIRKTIKDSNVLESFNKNNNKKDSTEIRKIIKDSEEFGIF